VVVVTPPPSRVDVVVVPPPPPRVVVVVVPPPPPRVDVVVVPPPPPRVDVVVVTGTDESSHCASTGSTKAAGPGNPAAASSDPEPVVGEQRVATTVDAAVFG
jgi:hypothetical protein